MGKQINFTASFVDLCYPIVQYASFQRITIFWERNISFCWFSCGSSVLVELEFGNICFEGWGGGKKNRGTRRKTLGARQKPTTNSTHIKRQAGIKPEPHWWWGKRSYHCAILAPQEVMSSCKNYEVKKTIRYYPFLRSHPA